MAVRERKGRASPFQVYWNNPFTGKRECANFATREEALKYDSLIKHRLRFERESFRPEDVLEAGDEAGSLTLEQAYFLYLQEKQFNKNGLYMQLAGMRMPLQLYGSKSIEAICREDLLHIIQCYASLPLKPTSRHRHLSTLRAMLNWSVEKGFRQPIKFPKVARGHYEKFIPPSPEEINLMLQNAEGHIRRIIILGSQCGIRVGPSELFKLLWADIDLDLGIIRVQAAHKNPAAPWREIPIRQSLLPVLMQWQSEDLAHGISHIIHYNGKPVASIKNAWTGMLRRAGISRRIRPYDLRHAFATELIAAGTDIGTIAKLMGHSSPNMIYQHYQFVLDKQKRAAVESLPDFAHVPKKMCPNKKEATEIQ